VFSDDAFGTANSLVLALKLTLFGVFHCHHALEPSGLLLQTFLLLGGLLVEDFCLDGLESRGLVMRFEVVLGVVVTVQEEVVAEGKHAESIPIYS
jgi:hypothetical protein